MSAPPDRYAVIGHPIAHSRSPRIHAAFAAAAGQHLAYDRIDAAPEAFEGIVRDFFDDGGCGLNVTLPHKESAARLADRLTGRARLAGAVNTLARQPDGTLLGDNTDGAGLMADLARLGIAVMRSLVAVRSCLEKVLPVRIRSSFSTSSLGTMVSPLTVTPVTL